MNTVTDWLAQYSQICRNLLEVLNGSESGFSDEKLIAVEAAIELRDEKLAELKGMEINESDKASYECFLREIKDMEADIGASIKAMMSELDSERSDVQEQRTGLNRLKVANRSYAGMVQPTEGYFIDKKK